MKLREVAAKVGLFYRTVDSICRKYRVNDYRLSPLRAPHPSKGKRKLDILKEKLLSTELLQEWATLTSKERANLISREHFYVTSPTLMRFYKEHGITYRKVGYRYALKDTIEEHRTA
jgi:transposase